MVTLKHTYHKFNEAVGKIKRWFKKEEKKIAEIAEYEETLLSKYGYSFIKKLFGPIIRWIWIEKIEGLENIPKEGPVILAANHESYFDFICKIAASPRKIHYLAAEKFYESKFWKPLMDITGQIKVDRKAKDKSKVYQLVYSALKQGRVIGFFPEGTRTRTGEINKAFVGVAKFALTAKVPVVPVGISGTYEIMSPHDKFPKFSKKVRIKFGPPMEFKEYHDINPSKEHHQIITDKIMLKISELCGKYYRHIPKEHYHIHKKQIKDIINKKESDK